MIASVEKFGLKKGVSMYGLRKAMEVLYQNLRPVYASEDRKTAIERGGFWQVGGYAVSKIEYFSGWNKADKYRILRREEVLAEY